MEGPHHGFLTGCPAPPGDRDRGWPGRTRRRPSAERPRPRSRHPRCRAGNRRSVATSVEHAPALCPARHDGLPDRPFPAEGGSFPSRDDVAAYLIDYPGPLRTAGRPRHPGHRSSLKDGISTDDHAGNHSRPTPWSSRPGPARCRRCRISRRISTHGSGSFTPIPTCRLTIPRGRVLVVGYGTSGAEIAEELAVSGRDVVISGTPTANVPDRLLKVAAVRGGSCSTTFSVSRLRSAQGRASCGGSGRAADSDLSQARASRRRARDRPHRRREGRASDVGQWGDSGDGRDPLVHRVPRGLRAGSRWTDSRPTRRDTSRRHSARPPEWMESRSWACHSSRSWHHPSSAASAATRARSPTGSPHSSQHRVQEPRGARPTPGEDVLAEGEGYLASRVPWTAQTAASVL